MISELPVKTKDQTRAWIWAKKEGTNYAVFSSYYNSVNRVNGSSGDICFINSL